MGNVGVGNSNMYPNFAHWYMSRDIEDLHRAGTLEANISKTVRDRGLVTMEHE